MVITSEDAILGALTTLASNPPLTVDEYAITIAPPFNSISAGLVRASYALEATRSPDHVSAIHLEDEQPFAIVLASKAIDAPRRPFVLLLIGTENDRARQVIGAFRLYPADSMKLSRLSSDALIGFAWLVSQYGAEYSIEGGQRTVFAPIVSFDSARFARRGSITNGELLLALGLPNDGPAYAVVAALRVLPSGEVVLVLPFVLRKDDYIDHVRKGSPSR